jgi:hypothetical protein
MNGGQESRRPRPTLGCSAIDDDELILSIYLTLTTLLILLTGNSC